MPNKEINGAIALLRSPTRAYQSIVQAAIDASSCEQRDALSGALRRSDFRSLLAWSDTVSPQLYGTPAAYFSAAQIQSLIRKYPFTKAEIPDLDPEAEAVKKFLHSEHRCKRVNQRRRLTRKYFSRDKYSRFQAIAKGYIRGVLGAKPDYQAIYDLCDFTAGASLGVHGNKTNIARKVLSERWTVTPPALFHAKRALWSNIHLRDCILPGAIKCYDIEQFDAIVRARVSLVDHNLISFVPKTAKTHRSIAVEPLLNGFVQKGTDEFIRKRLKRRASVDLSDQSVNQALSYLGSHGGFNPYCTIDLSAASDSMSLEVIRDYLPKEWFDFLMEIRSPYYRLDAAGQSVRYEKFCSMGNGFCFPLQTLLFLSVCYACSVVNGDSPTDFTSYGDDIVVRQNVALLVIELLRDIGFRVNVDKTFITGPFRESCGTDWYNGQDVRPVFLDSRLSDVQEAMSLHNTFLRSPVTEQASHEVRDVIRSLIPPQWRYLRPGREPGDGALSVPLDIAMCSPFVKWVSYHKDRKISQCWSWREILATADKDTGVRTLSEVERANVLLLAAMRGSSSQNPFPVRYATTRRSTLVSRWSHDRFDGVDDRFARLTNVRQVGCVRAQLRALAGQPLFLLSGA